MANPAPLPFSGSWLALTALAAAAACAMSPQRAVANEVDFNLNDDAARLSFAFVPEARNWRLGGGWLHHQETGDIAHVDGYLTGNASSSANPVETGIGGKLLFIDADRLGKTGGALAVGGFLRFALPRYNRISFGGALYFAPDVSSFSGLGRYTEISAYAAYNVLRDADLYLGYRNVKADFNGRPEATMDTGMNIGFRLRF